MSYAPPSLDLLRDANAPVAPVPEPLTELQTVVTPVNPVPVQLSQISTPFVWQSDTPAEPPKIIRSGDPTDISNLLGPVEIIFVVVALAAIIILVVNLFVTF